MAYKALYRTYRPTNFDEVAGQQHIVKTLQNAVRQNKIAHAYLFCGPRGTGKTTIAKIFAKAINCEADDNKPCLKCSNCLAVQDGSHPDVIEIDAASNNGVDEVRELIEKVKYAPLKGKYKAYIIDEVHMMSAGAFNALLKTIEEPPEHVIFIFATTEPQKVLPTIISRCQRYDFTKVSINDMKQRLITVLNYENIKYDDEAIRLICQLADGGVRDAFSILDQVIAYAQDEVQVHHVNEIYGIMTVKEKIELLQMVGDKDALNLMNKVSALIEKGIDIKRCTMDLIDILKETVIHDYTQDSSMLKILADDEIHSAKINKSTKERLKMIEYLMDAYDKYRFAANVGSYFEVCLLNMIEPEVQTTVQKPIKAEERKNVSRETLKPVQTIPEPEAFYMPEPEFMDMPQEIVVERKAKPTVVREAKSAKPLKDEMILRLLVGANKAFKQADSDKMKALDDYYHDPAWAKEANLLRGSKIVASGEQYVILSVDNQAIANQINELDSDNKFLSFMNLVLSKSKKVFAITATHQSEVIKEFVRRQKNGTLPEPMSFEIEEEKKTEKSDREIVTDLFGEENLIIKED